MNLTNVYRFKKCSQVIETFMNFYDFQNVHELPEILKCYLYNFPKLPTIFINFHDILKCTRISIISINFYRFCKIYIILDSI